MCIHNIIKKVAKEDGEHLCIAKDDVRYTYNQLNQLVDNIAQRLATIANHGDKVIIHVDDAIQQLLYFLGASGAGLVSIICPPNSSEAQIKQLIKKTHPRIIINKAFTLPEDKKDLPTLNDKDYFLGALSSGTTGEKKIIWRDYKSWTQAFPFQSNIFNIKKKDRLFLQGQFSYTANLNSALHILSEGGSIILTESKKPKGWVKIIEEYSVNTIFMVPAYYRLLVKHVNQPIVSIKSVVSAGEKLDFLTATKLFELFSNAKITEYYGASELGHVTYISGEDMLLKRGSVGRAFPGVKISIKENLIWVASPYIAPEYGNAATVGDIGHIDEEGFIFLEGRKGNVINKGGVKIHPEQIQNKILNHPKIQQAIVIGTPHPIKGEEIAIIIKKVKGLNLHEVRLHCNTILEPEERPKKILFIDQFPLNESGKVDKKKLKIELSQ